MKISALLATGLLALGIGTAGASAEDAASPNDFLQIISVIENVGSTTAEIGQIRRVSDVRLVPLDDLSAGKNWQALVRALDVQRGTAAVDALREAIAGNRQLVAELQRQRLDYRNIVAIDIGESGTITVYTFGAWA